MVEGPVHVTYEIVADGTKRRREKLVDSLGYAYNVKERGKVTTYWPCTVGNVTTIDYEISKLSSRIPEYCVRLLTVRIYFIFRFKSWD